MQQEIHSLSPSINAPEVAALSVNSAPINAGNSFTSRANANNCSSNRPNSSQQNNGKDNCRNGKSTFHCDYCGYNNHTKDVCNKLHGFPNDRSRNPSKNQNFSEWALLAPPLITQEQYNKILTMLSSGSTNPQANLVGIAFTANYL